MVATESTMLPLGTQAPDFALPDTDGQTVALKDLTGDVLVVAFICNHCPYVKHLAPALAALATSYEGQPVSFVAISSNDVVRYPADSPEKMAEEKAQQGYTFPYLYDETQEVAKAYKAACTPDFYVFDEARALAYTGRFDETRPYRISSGHYDDRDGRAHGGDIKAAVDALLAGQRPSDAQLPSIGCNIKWKPGNEPNY